MEKNIINEFWEYVEKQNTKVSDKVYNWLNYDNLSSIQLNDKVFYYELTNSYTKMPNYIHYYIIKWGEKKGLTYLFNIK